MRETTVIAKQEEEQQEAKYLTALFRVDPELLEKTGRSLKLLLLHRRCATCWGTLVQEPNMGMEIKADAHLKQLARHCSQTPDFIRSGMPVMEATFRVLLANGNKAMTLEAIHDALEEKWTDYANPRTPTPDRLYRMISREKFYGISEQGKK